MIRIPKLKALLPLPAHKTVDGSLNRRLLEKEADDGLSSQHSKRGSTNSYQTKC